jgi:hypothetical protein
MTILARKKTSYDTSAIGHGSEQYNTVRHALVAGDTNLCRNLWRPENVKLRHTKYLPRYPIAIQLRGVEQSLQIFHITSEEKR